VPELRIPGDRALILDDEAHCDEAALLAFLGGHCHSLALALHERTGWPLVAVDQRSDGVCVHVAVRRPDGTIVDIAGAHTPDAIDKSRAGGTIIREVTASDLDDLAQRHGWAEPVPDIVAPWVQVALDQAEREPRAPMASATFACSRTTLSAIDVRVLWDGEPDFGVEVRTADPARPWRRYGRFGFHEDDDGLYRFAFTMEWFTPRAEAWLDHEFDEQRARHVLAA
jgi:hypothetical protein